MNMTNPLSDPAFNETYQHYIPTDSPSEANPQQDDDVIHVDDDDVKAEQNSHDVIMNMTNPLSDPEFNYTYQHSDHATMEPHISPAKNKTLNHHPSITISDPSPPPKTTQHKSCSTNASWMRRMMCQTTTFSQNHPFFAVLSVGAALFVTLRFVRNRRRSMSRGEYRAVAAHYIDTDFDDSLDDISHEFLDEDDWTGKRTIEMASFGDELTLEEVNG
jgi:hypothetical protein